MFLVGVVPALVELVPLLLPLAQAYGIHPPLFGIIFLAAMEVGFLCPPAELNIYFALAMFNKNIRYVAASGLPQWVLRMEPHGQRFLRSGARCW